MREIILITSMWIVSVCTFISYVPQLFKLIKTKKSEDLSVTSWVLWTLSAVCNMIYSIALLRTELILASLIELTFTMLTLILSIVYKNNKQTVELLGVELDYKEDYEYIALIGIVSNWYANKDAIEIIAKECNSIGVLTVLKNNKDIPAAIREVAEHRISDLSYNHLDKVSYVSGDWTLDNL